jgi:plastocyanin
MDLLRVYSRACGCAAILCLSLLAGPIAAEAGKIHGHVRMSTAPSGPTVAVNPYPGRASSMTVSQVVRHGGPDEAVVFVDRVATGVDTSLRHGIPKLAQKDQSFVPRVLAVASGGTVDFPNFDPIYHNVFSVSPVKRFDLGKYPRGQSKRVKFSQPGVVNVYCDIHSDMAAFIVVVPNRFYTQPDADGGYALPDLPAGRYTVRVWHPDHPEARHEVVVSDGASTALDVTL